MDVSVYSTTRQGVLIDIEAELAYWEQIIPKTEFAQVSLRFDHFVPTIKFGYDCYLLYHHHKLAETLPILRERYYKVVPGENQLDWRWADQIIRHTWGRLLAA